uniref:R3H domain-containing nucleic acid-binding protein n=1 Tax=Trichocoleus desertorum TaxID=1481672 RepID=UPI0025B3A482|nr:R3H domain-containing nucleic acid-binding protein [Trichocoleus desertorum]
MQITDDLQKLLKILPSEIQQVLEQHPERDRLVEVVLDLGRRPEARFPHGAEYLAEQIVTRTQIQDCIDRLGDFGGDNRAGIEQTLHRISAIRNRSGEIVGLTCRVGRAIFGTIAMIRDLVETGQSILMLGRPGVGKTTALREIARVLADDLNKRVVIIDSSNEIAGDGDIPHPAIGRARRMQVARPELQHQVMIEAVENHMPEVIVIDEIGTELEALAARTIAERGVQLVGTAHGNQIENLIKNPTLSDLVGGIQSVTLGDEEAKRRGSQKSVLERKAPPTFDIAVEMLERQRWVVHETVADSVDALLRGRQPNPEIRTINDEGQVIITREVPSLSPLRRPNAPTGNASFSQTSSQNTGQLLSFPQKLSRSKNLAEVDSGLTPEEALELSSHQPLRLYLYGTGRQQLEQVIGMLNLPVVLVDALGEAEAILALRSHLRKHANLRHLAQAHDIPIYAIKSNSTPQIIRTLRQVLGMPGLEAIAEPDFGLGAEQIDEGDEMDALEEARLAVEQIVLPKGQPVELLPRASHIRKMQHELVEHYQLQSSSFGSEPHRRLRIYPA